jgi:hypothetical protein
MALIPFSTQTWILDCASRLVKSPPTIRWTWFWSERNAPLEKIATHVTAKEGGKGNARVYEIQYNPESYTSLNNLSSENSQLFLLERCPPNFLPEAMRISCFCVELSHDTVAPPEFILKALFDEQAEG